MHTNDQLKVPFECSDEDKNYHGPSMRLPFSGLTSNSTGPSDYDCHNIIRLCDRVEESRLPASGDINTETPFGRRIRFVATNLPRLLVHRSVKSMTVNRRGTCVHPQAGRMNGVTNRLT